MSKATILGDVKALLANHVPPVGHKPKHKHDCKACIFLKNSMIHSVPVDWYICPNGESVIARDGVNGNYSSFPASILNEYVREARNGGFTDQGQKLVAWMLAGAKPEAFPGDTL